VSERNGRQGAAPHAPPTTLAQATLRPRSELECERLVRLAHRRGIASATAYRGPDDSDASRAAARLLVEGVASAVAPFHAVFPFGTMAVNVAGSFAIAIFGTLLFERFVEERERMFWVLGFLGSLTTFSSYVLQTTEGWEASPFLGSLYAGASLVLGFLGALLGLRLTRRLLRWR
jgi:CrcB protein